MKDFEKKNLLDLAYKKTDQLKKPKNKAKQTQIKRMERLHTINNIDTVFR